MRLLKSLIICKTTTINISINIFTTSLTIIIPTTLYTKLTSTPAFITIDYHPVLYFTLTITIAPEFGLHLHQHRILSYHINHRQLHRLLYVYLQMYLHRLRYRPSPALHRHLHFQRRLNTDSYSISSDLKYVLLRTERISVSDVIVSRPGTGYTIRGR